MTHKFYCPNCTHYLFANTLTNLVHALNTHNRVYHPFAADNWETTAIAASTHYEVVEDEPPPYVSDKMAVVKPIPVKLGGKDAEWLSSLGVKWD